MASVSAVRAVVDAMRKSVASGAGLNLLQAATRMADGGDASKAVGLLRRAASKGTFGGQMDSVEKEALRRLVKELPGDSMPVKEFAAAAADAAKEPLLLGPGNFPQRMADLGFVPMTGVNMNRPTLTIAGFRGPTREAFIDEGARNLIAAVDLDREAAEQYARFYPRVQEQLAATGAPLENIGGAWATLSAQAEPVWNAELLRRIVRNPEELTTSVDNQMLALRFLAGQVDSPAEALGQGKRFNFMMNSIAPDDPRFLTADTRYAQNLQGIKNTYKRAPFAGMFDPTEASNRYGNIYVQPGLKAAERLGMSPNALQAAAWGNWRNRMFGIPNDLDEDLLVDLADLNYDPSVYARALRNLSGRLP